MGRKLVLGGIVAVVLAAGRAGAAEPPAPVPDEKNYERWVAFIRPSAGELAFQEIGWRNAFWPAVEEARELGRPILLWTMNGHPLGCT